MTVNKVIAEAEERMKKALEGTRREFATIRSGKASPALLDTVRVEAYGSQVPIQQVGSVSAPEPRLLVVQPWDRSLVKAIHKAILQSELGLNPQMDGELIRIPIPALTEERRKDLVKVMHKLGEEGKVAVRHARGEAHAKIKKLDKIAEDDRTRGEKELQKVTDEHIKQIDQLIAAKEAEIMEV